MSEVWHCPLCERDTLGGGQFCIYCGPSVDIRDLSRSPMGRKWFGPYQEKPEGPLVMWVRQGVLNPFDPPVQDIVFAVRQYNVRGLTFYFHVRQGLRKDTLAEAMAEAAQAATLLFLVGHSKAGRAFGWRSVARQKKLHPSLWDLCGPGSRLPSRLIVGGQ